MSNIVVLCTCPDAVCASELANAIVEKRLAACVNRLDGLTSTYRWQGEVKNDQESLLIIKTRQDRLESLSEFIQANHAYDVPEVIALTIDGGSRAYLDWISEAVV